MCLQFRKRISKHGTKRKVTLHHYNVLPRFYCTYFKNMLFFCSKCMRFIYSYPKDSLLFHYWVHKIKISNSLVQILFRPKANTFLWLMYSKLFVLLLLDVSMCVTRELLKDAVVFFLLILTLLLFAFNLNNINLTFILIY